MKKMIAILFVLTVGAFAGVKEDVTKTLNTHFKGIENGEIKLLEEAWMVKDAQISEIKSGKIIKHDTKKTFAFWTMQKNPNLNGKVISITEVAPNLVVAKVSLNWKGSQFTDALTLTKTLAGWKIINKTGINQSR